MDKKTWIANEHSKPPVQPLQVVQIDEMFEEILKDRQRRGEMEEQPTLTIDHDGVKTWRLDNLLHRDHGPAIEWPDGRQDWYQHGNLHRDDGPASVTPGGASYYFKHGVRHRLDGPAIEWESGHKEWYVEGKAIEGIDVVAQRLQAFKEDLENTEKPMTLDETLARVEALQSEFTPGSQRMY